MGHAITCDSEDFFVDAIDFFVDSIFLQRRHLRAEGAKWLQKLQPTFGLSFSLRNHCYRSNHHVQNRGTRSVKMLLYFVFSVLTTSGHECAGPCHNRHNNRESMAPR